MNRKKLLVVYKNEKDRIAADLLKALIETKDDTDDTIIGTEDGTVETESCNEVTWLTYQMRGEADTGADKFLFIGDINGADRYTKIMDVKLQKYGVTYGFVGSRAILLIDEKALNSVEKYEQFHKALNDISDRPIARETPEIRMRRKRDVFRSERKDINILLLLVSSSAYMAKSVKAALQTAKRISHDKKLVREQMLTYGIIHLYYNELEHFMKS